MSAAEAAALLASVQRVLLLRGSALKELDARGVTPDQLRGPTGKIRAPLVKVGATLLAGFRPDALVELLESEAAAAKSRARRASPTSAPNGGALVQIPSDSSRKAKSKAVSRKRS